MLNEKYIGDNLHYIRKHEINKTQEQFAELIGVTPDTISNIECGKVCPSLRNIIEIANVTGKPIEYFLKERID